MHPRPLSLVALLSALAAAPAPSHASQDELRESVRELTAPLSVRPALVITVAVVTHGRTAGEASQLNADRMVLLLAALRRQRLPEGALVTSGHAIAREDEWDGTGRAARDDVIHTAYSARDAVRITVTDLASLGALLDTALAAGATEVTRVQLATSVLEERRHALSTAVAAARGRAESLAGPNRMLGRVLEIGLLVRLLSCR